MENLDRHRLLGIFSSRAVRTALGVLVLLAAAALIAACLQGYLMIGDMSQRVHQTLASVHAPYTPLARISPYAQEGVIASQDKRFYGNMGVDALAMARAALHTALSARREGASTITEQLAKNVYFQDVDSFQTDIATKFLALLITLRYPKRTILELYLNEVIFGPDARGLGEASRLYFGVAPDRITLAQAAYLIGLINAPGYYASHPHAATEEAVIILEMMSRNNYITVGQQTAAQAAIHSMGP
jgi:membrane peptidoglycan carboxypeptidase